MFFICCDLWIMITFYICFRGLDQDLLGAEMDTQVATLTTFLDKVDLALRQEGLV
jgi:hypothetical protein